MPVKNRFAELLPEAVRNRSLKGDTTRHFTAAQRAIGRIINFYSTRRWSIKNIKLLIRSQTINENEVFSFQPGAVR